ncbi:MAG: hypothetical protein AB2L24_18395 [Mangrovibacterium sp.]
MNKTLIFHLGHSAGFYSEFNNMVLALLYCKHNNIEFKLYSKDANFKIKNGWSDFFLPFCKETKNPIHKYINERQESPKDELYINRRFWWFCWKYRKYIGTPFRIHTLKLYKFLFPNIYLTYELWNNFRFMTYTNDEIIQMAKPLIANIYRLNWDTKNDINRFIQTLPFKEYIGIHIRGGDKVMENRLYEPKLYMEEVKRTSTLKNIFVFTDDYRLFVQIKNENPDYNFYTIVDETDKGFSISMMKEDIVSKRKRMIKMFASIEIMSRAELIVGTLTSNPGMFLGMRFPEKTLFIDSEKWRVI